MRQFQFTLLLSFLSSIALGIIVPLQKLPSSGEAALGAQYHGQNNPPHWSDRWKPGQLYMLSSAYRENYGATFLKPDPHDDPNNPNNPNKPGSLLVAMIVKLAHNRAVFTIPVSDFVQTQHDGLVYRVMSVPAGEIQVYPDAGWASEFQLSPLLVDNLLDQFWPVGCETAIVAKEQLSWPAASEAITSPAIVRGLIPRKIHSNHKLRYPDIDNDIFYVLGVSIEDNSMDVVGVLTRSTEGIGGKQVVNADEKVFPLHEWRTSSPETLRLLCMRGKGYQFYRDVVTRAHHVKVEKGSEYIVLPRGYGLKLKAELYPERGRQQKAS